MSKEEKVRFALHLDKELKNDAAELFSNLGLSFNSAVEIFLRQAVQEQGFPFKPSLKKDNK